MGRALEVSRPCSANLGQGVILAPAFGRRVALAAATGTVPTAFASLASSNGTLPPIKATLVSADGISADYYSLQHRMRISFQEASIHISARITFVTVGDHIPGLAVSITS